MASDLKIIIEAVVNKLAKVAGLNIRTVDVFSGDLAEFLMAVHNVPFAGVHFIGSRYENYTCDNGSCEEHISFEVLLVLRDLRGKSYGQKAALDLIDHVRDALMGHILIAGLAPAMITEIGDHESLQDFGCEGYHFKFETWQTR